MEITNFQDLLAVAKKQPDPQRLLFLFVKTNSEGTNPKNGLARGTIQPIMCVDKTPEEVLSFGALKAEADHFGKPWDLMFIAALPGRGGKMPTTEDASPHLEKMTNSIAAGMSMHEYVIFDRQENPVILSVER